jgi:hypothetical protein
MLPAAIADCTQVITVNPKNDDLVVDLRPILRRDRFCETMACGFLLRQLTAEVGPKRKSRDVRVESERRVKPDVSEDEKITKFRLCGRFLRPCSEPSG